MGHRDDRSVDGWQQRVERVGRGKTRKERLLTGGRGRVSHGEHDHFGLKELDVWQLVMQSSGI